jgi:6-pyruvoyltetrahydropterin/6-carboxytetrahydropterin synthase
MIASETIRVTKEFSFEMAHALHGYDGPCKNIHGHSYKLSVTVIGKTISESNIPKQGMVIDFTDLKKLVKELIVDELDHALVLNEESPHKNITNSNALFGKIVLKKFQPTCENLLIDFAGMIRKKLPDNIELHHLKLQETEHSYAEWYAKDNK